MRLSLRVLGLDLIDLEITTDSEAADSDEPTPRTFGFHASGSGLIERQPDEATDLDAYDRR